MRFAAVTTRILPVVALLAAGGVATAGQTPQFGPAQVTFDGKPAPPASSSVCGFSLVARGVGPQLACLSPAGTLIAGVRGRQQIVVAVPVRGVNGPVSVAARAEVCFGEDVEVRLSLGGDHQQRSVLYDKAVQLELSGQGSPHDGVVCLVTTGGGSEAAVRWSNVRMTAGGRSWEIPMAPPDGDPQRVPPPVLPEVRIPIERELIEWDWRMQDGIGTQRAAVSYAEATRRTLQRGDALIRDLKDHGTPLPSKETAWAGLWKQWKELSAGEDVDGAAGEDLWRRVHRLRREIVLENPLARLGPLALVKRVPSAFSHQLTQYYGRDARPGGGIFVLPKPGKSMQSRQLAAALPEGSYQHLDVSHDGRRVLFSFCPVDRPPKDRNAHGDRFYHLYETASDGTALRQLTDGPFDDFSPRYLPDGKILFISTRRRGFHRCGRGPCPVYTLAIAQPDGSNPRPISYHETHEWDPAVLHDGRVIYTRWDYVDRHAVHYQQLWTVRPDGSDVRIFYGNGTFNPVGVWEARPVPGSHRVMATAAAHHAMTAGSIILLDVTRGLDGPEPITRLTPDALFPESEVPVVRQPSGYWHAPVGVARPPEVPPEAERWPGHCYRTPFPLSEDYFLAAYSFDRLIGEPTANRANMFGLYLLDRFGNKELIYRDLNVSSLWPMPLRPRRKPPGVPSVARQDEPPHDGPRQGTFLLQNVYQSWPALPRRQPIKRLRIVQVLPKSTPHINDPPVGIPNASPGKQVLGTVPVEPDGSAHFRAPAGVPLAFQALDERGQAAQIMRSITYLQPGEASSCIGCHEPRTAAAPSRRGMARALGRPPSEITPGPDGSNPLSYPILVQPVLDKHCVSCHKAAKPEGGVVLTSQPQGRYTVSYNALAPLVAYSAWGGRPGDFRQVNSEPATRPGHFGARGSQLMKLILDGHYDVRLGAREIERLATWMDANALFYGTFDPADQQRQQRGERIRAAALQ